MSAWRVLRLRSSSVWVSLSRSAGESSVREVKEYKTLWVITWQWMTNDQFSFLDANTIKVKSSSRIMWCEENFPYIWNKSFSNISQLHCEDVSWSELRSTQDYWDFCHIILPRFTLLYHLCVLTSSPNNHRQSAHTYLQCRALFHTCDSALSPLIRWHSLHRSRWVSLSPAFRMSTRL